MKAKRRTGRAGLTLVELLFAISVTAMTGLGVAGMFPAAFRSVVSGGQVTKATILAQAMVDMIRNDPFDTLVSRYHGFDSRGLTVTCPVAPSGFDPAYNKKKWTCDLLASTAQSSGRGLPSGYGTVSVACLNADGTSGACSSTDLRLVTVVVTWGGQGSRSVSLVTYVARTE
jgi:Tfp pilus assembly protein PilV